MVRGLQLLLATVAADPRQRIVVLGALAGAQPARAYAQQLGNLVQTRHGHAALEPVVHMLRRHPALGGKVGSGQVALAQERFQTITRCIHGA
ncbi:hypothetical protein D3C77_697280 [compost metagenome]